MTTNKKDPVLVILQMSGAYDALNTFIPYSDPHYADYRQVLRLPPEEVFIGVHRWTYKPDICHLTQSDKAAGFYSTQSRFRFFEMSDCSAILSGLLGAGWRSPGLLV